MLLEGKNAVIYGAGGLGAGIARTFAAEGATVFVAGRSRAPLQALAADFAATGADAEATVLDALDEAAVQAHLRDVVARAGSVDISLNLTSREDRQGTPLIDMRVEDYTRGPHTALTSQFTTARAAARHMIEQGRGVILSITSGTARAPSAGVGNTPTAPATSPARSSTSAAD